MSLLPLDFVLVLIDIGVHFFEGSKARQERHIIIPYALRGDPFFGLKDMVNRNSSFVRGFQSNPKVEKICTHEVFEFLANLERFIDG